MAINEEAKELREKDQQEPLSLFKDGEKGKKLNSWCQRFRSLDNEEGREIRSTRIAIARKGPRLCELYHVSQDDFDISDVISEHAIPFLFSGEELKDRIKLTDEAIYHGTTFSRIYTVLLTAVAVLGKRRILKREIKAVPAIMTVDGRDHSLKSKVTFDVPDLNELIINDKEVPEFINGLIEDFLTLHKPFDVEFPIFYLKVKKEFLESTKVREFIKVLAGGDVSAIYCNNHYVDGHNLYNYSWLLSQEPYHNRNQVEADFVKVRFFPDRKRERLAIVCYAPHLFPDSCICENTPLFTDPKIKSIWQEAWRAAPSLKYQTEDGRMEFVPEYKELKDEYRQYLISNKYPVEDEKNWIYQLEEYEYHRKRSFVILANYLLSFQKAQDLSDRIKIAAEEVFDEKETFSFGVDSADLSYLVGHRLGKEFSRRLNEYYGNKEVSTSFSIYMEALKSSNIMPEKYKARYEAANDKMMAKCHNVSELISVVFSNVHQFVELSGRQDPLEDLDRLRFGESFVTFNTRAAVYLPEIGVYTKIHQGMDFRIDNGSAVPKYVCQTDHPDKPWLRLFRSGENEDKMMEQQLRLLSIILGELYKTARLGYLSETKIALAFNFILNRDLEEVNDNRDAVSQKLNILPIHYKMDRCKLVRVPVVETEITGVANRDVLSFCIDYGLLKRVEGTDNYKISQEEKILEYQKDRGFFREELYNYIVEGIEKVNRIYDFYKEDSAGELLNWLYISEEQLKKIQDKLNEWILLCKQHIREENIRLKDVDRFYDVLKKFPVDGDNIIENLEVIPEEKWHFYVKKNSSRFEKQPGLYKKLHDKGVKTAQTVQKMLEYFWFGSGKNEGDFWKKCDLELGVE